jgi:hypothetical protein
MDAGGIRKKDVAFMVGFISLLGIIFFSLLWVLGVFSV